MALLLADKTLLSYSIYRYHKQAYAKSLVDSAYKSGY